MSDIAFSVTTQCSCSPDPTRLLTAREVGRMLGMDHRKVYQLPIQQIRISDHRVRYAQSDVASFIRKCRRGA